MTLVELLVSFSVFSIILVIVGPILTSYLNVSRQVVASYANSDEVLTSAIAFQKLIRQQVSPAPTPSTGAGANIPAPPFPTTPPADRDTGQYSSTPTTASVGPFSTIFYTNVGSTLGPARVVATETQNPLVSGEPQTWTLNVTEQLPDSGSCPGVNANGTTCTYTNASNNPPREVMTIPYIVNNDTTSPTDTALTYTPIFTYILLEASTSPGTPASEVTVSGFTPPPSGYSFGTLTEPNHDDSIFQTCTATVVDTPVADSCPGDVVMGVTVDLLIQAPGSQTAEDETTTFTLSPTSSQYNALVG